MKRRLVVAAALAALVGLALPATPVSAHAGLESSTPSASSVLEESPESIVLDFDEAVEAPLTTIGLFDAEARPIEIGAPVAVSGDGSIVQASLPDLADGLYAVSWRITSVDGHVVDGAFSFQIGTAVTDAGDADSLLGQVADGVSATSAVERLLSVARLLAFLGVVVLLGAGLFAAAAPAHLAERRGTMVLLWCGAVSLLLGSLLQYGFQAAYAAAGTVGDAFSPSVWGLIDQTGTGRTILLRIVLAAVLVGLLALFRHRATAWWRSLTLATALATVVSFPAGGHASSLSPRLLWTAVDALHLAAMAAWLGGLVLFTVGRRVWLHDEAAAPLVRRFSAAAAVCVPVIVATGVAQTWKLSGGFDGITDTAWGRTLLVKVAVVTALVAVGGVSRWMLRHAGVASLGRTVAVEAVLGVAVVALAAGMVGLAPQPAAESQVFSSTLTTAGVIVDVTVTPGRVGGNEMHLVITPPGGSLQPVTGASARVSLPERDIPDAPVTLTADGPNHFSGPLTLPYAGSWTLELIIETEPGNSVLLVAQVPIP
jgi:copper transport protein